MDFQAACSVSLRSVYVLLLCNSFSFGLLFPSSSSNLFCLFVFYEILLWKFPSFPVLFSSMLECLQLFLTFVFFLPGLCFGVRATWVYFIALHSSCKKLVTTSMIDSFDVEKYTADSVLSSHVLWSLPAKQLLKGFGHWIASTPFFGIYLSTDCHLGRNTGLWYNVAKGFCLTWVGMKQWGLVLALQAGWSLFNEAEGFIMWSVQTDCRPVGRETPSHSKQLKASKYVQT